MLIGYMRPYQEDPKCADQLQKLKNVDCTIIIAEEHASAKKRTHLMEMLTNLNRGDKIIITKLFTLADSTHHLVELLETIEIKRAYLQSLTEGIDTSHTDGYHFNDIVKHLLVFQSDVISEKTKQGMYEAKLKGVSTGRPRKPDENVKRAITMYQSKKYSLAEIKEKTGISKSTLYRYLESEIM
ncbi:recombinase family protein [Peribacillus loiseleuriae]|uniref:recombinase family protein n=1 Tax=Peribacillus loiseleuriae TaxID=1679170 RepID=UPI003CFE8802